MAQTDPQLAAYESWLRANGAPLLVARRGRLRGLLGTLAGVAAIVTFTFRWFFDALTRRSSAMLNVVPLLLIAVTLSFFSTETWQTVGSLHGLPLVLTILLFVGLAAVFVSRRGRPDLDELGRFADAAAVTAALPARLPHAPVDEPPTSPRLRRPERANLLVVSVLAQVVVAVVVALAVAAFFVILGLLTVDADVTTGWIGHRAGLLGNWRIAGHRYALSSELLRVSAFLGAFAGFYFIVSGSTDPRLRSELAAGHDEHLRACLAVRLLYRRRLAAPRG